MNIIQKVEYLISLFFKFGTRKHKGGMLFYFSGQNVVLLRDAISKTGVLDNAIPVVAEVAAAESDVHLESVRFEHFVFTAA